MRLALVLAVVAGTLTAAGTADARRSCDDLRGREIERNSAVRVVAQRGPVRYVACLRGTRRRISLGRRVGRVALAGAYVAYDPLRVAGGLGLRSTGVVRRNLRTGAYRRVNETEGLPPASRIVANRRGEVAWLHPRRNEIWKLDGNGSDPSLLEDRPSRRSLRLAGSRLAWREDGRRRALRLGRPEACGHPSSRGTGMTREVRLLVPGVACHRASGRRTSIFPAASVTASGRFVAYDNVTHPAPRQGGPYRARLRVLDSATGAVVRSWDSEGAFVGDLVITSGGSIAWVAFASASGVQVLKSDATGHAVVLEGGFGSMPRLSLRGHALSWRGPGGERRRAVLADP